MKPNIQKRSFDFSVKTLRLCKVLVKNKHEYILSKQLFRSGTSIGANIREAQNAESKLDFIHKLSISQKECDETIYWLELLFELKIIEEKIVIELINDATVILKILKTIIIKIKSNYKKGFKI